MDQDAAPPAPILRPRRRLAAALLLCCAGMTAAPSRAEAPADPEALLSWALNRSDTARTWELAVADQRKVVDELTQRIEALGVRTEELRALLTKHPTGPLPLHLALGDDPAPEPLLAVVSRVGGRLRFVAYDAEGRKLEAAGDGGEADERRLATLERYLPRDEVRWRDPGRMPRWARDVIILGVMSIVGVYESDFLDRLDDADTRLREAEQDLGAAIGRARSLPPHLARLVLDAAELRLVNVRRDRDRLLGDTLAKQETKKLANTVRERLGDVTHLWTELGVLLQGEQAKLDALVTQPSPWRLTDRETEIINYLRDYLAKKDQDPDAANRSLAGASRLWRREAAERLGPGPGSGPGPAAIPGAPPGR